MRVRPWSLRLFTVALLAAAPATACAPAGGTGPGEPGAAVGPTAPAGAAQGTAAAGAPDRSASPTAPGAPTGAPVPASLKFTAHTLDGRTFDGASLAGHPTVLWFWAPWCATCFGQSASVAQAATEYSGKINIVGVAGLGTAAEMATFVDEGEVDGVTHLDDSAGALWKKFGITEQSQFVMLDSTGRQVQKGWLDSATLAEWLRYLVAK